MTMNLTEARDWCDGWKLGLNFYNIPADMWPSMCAYVIDGEPPGEFLTAVFSNDLVEAATLANESNQRRLRGYAWFLYCHAPRECWGTPEIQQAWIKTGGLIGRLTKEKANA